MGSRTERQLLTDVEDLGWIGLRAPASGARPGVEAGDLWVGRAIPDADYHVGQPASWLYIIEEKYKSNNKNRYIQEDGEKLDSMIDLAERLGATPVLAVRWSNRTPWSPGTTHYCLDARKVERTKSGNVSVKPETAEDRFLPTAEFFE